MKSTKFVLSFLAAVILFFAVRAVAQTTNTLSDAEVQGRQLAQKLLDERPAENFTNTGVLQIRNGNGKNTKLYLTVTTTVNTDDYLVNYEARTNSNGQQIEWLKVIKSAGHPAIYYSSQHHKDWIESSVFDASLLRGGQTMVPFASSDFWIADLGLEFFHWPQQKVLKREIKRSRGCTVLESTNPDPSTNGYARVVSWIDSESGGIVQAEAYDFKNKLLKEFAPKSFQKVNGQWELQEMEIYNDQTGSRTRLDFDLKKP